MFIFSITKWVKKLSITSKFQIIIVCIVLSLLFGLASFLIATQTLSGIRAYVGGEGLWSKAQKEATNSLYRYSISLDESDYQDFLNFLKIPLGDKKARLELEKNNPDLNIAKEGFLNGGNHPDDLDGLIFLFRRFRNVSYMDRAIKIWAEGDKEIENLLSVGEQMHEIISVYKENPSVQERKSIDLEINSLLNSVKKTDEQLTLLENQFSSILGEGSRGIGKILIEVMIVLSILFGVIILYIAIYIAKIITKVDQAKSEFVSLASHQLRTPLTSIGWNTERILSGEDGVLNEKQKGYFEEINISNQKMINLVNSLLNVSKIELGGFVIEPISTDICSFVRDVIDELKPISEKRNLKVQELCQVPVLVLIDRDLIRIVLHNLITNAVHYTPVGGNINVEISIKQKGEMFQNKKIKENSVLVSVSDNGYGIPEKEQNNIFSKLYRASNAGSKYTEGTGLGLYVTKAIIDNASGTIWFNSQENRGTTFYFTIPMTGMKMVKNTKKLELFGSSKFN